MEEIGKFELNITGLLGRNDSYERMDDLYDVPLFLIILLSICYGTVSVVAVIGNMCVLWIVGTSRRMQTVTNFFIANLAFADIIIGLFAVPFQFQAALLQRWELPWFMCPFCPFVQAISVNVSTLTLTAIAMDRYRAIMKPLMAHTTKFRAKLAIVGIWIVAGIAGVPYVIAFRVELVSDESKRNHTKPFCRNVAMPPYAWKLYSQVLVFLQYLIPLCVISYAYCKMGVRLRNTRTPGNAQNERDATLIKNKKKVIKMLFMVVALFAICWLPFQAYNLLNELIPSINRYRYINVIWFCSHWLAMSNSCYNPFIYAIYNERFNTEFRTRFLCCLKSLRLVKENELDNSLSSRYG